MVDQDFSNVVGMQNNPWKFIAPTQKNLQDAINVLLTCGHPHSFGVRQEPHFEIYVNDSGMECIRKAAE